MNASSKITANMANGLAADASKVSPTQFLAVVLDRFMPAPPVTRISEQADAARRYIDAIWTATGDVSEIQAAYKREKAEIDARYAEPILDVHPVGDGERGMLWL